MSYILLPLLYLRRQQKRMEFRRLKSMVGPCFSISVIYESTCDAFCCPG